jgi:N-acyl homoserine lactone hydrolase
MSTYTVHPLQTAKAERRIANYTYLRDNNQTIAVFYGAFLLKSPDRNVLVDTGCDAVNYAAGPLSPVEDVASLQQNLGRLGLSIREIDAVILTHLHFDHTAFLHLFQHCPKFVQEREWHSALHPHPYFSCFYVPRFFQDVDFQLIDGDRVLFPGIEAALVPGHSAGSQAVIVETNDGRAAISGFCCLAQNFDKVDFAIPGIHENLQQSYDSMLKLMGLADIVYANHSSDAVRL